MNNDFNCIVQLVRDREKELRDYLNYLGQERKVIKGVPDIAVRTLNTVIQWIFPEDPVRTKNLEKIAGHLHDILIYFDSVDKSSCSELRTAPLCSLIEQMRCPSEISSNNAWELADLLEVELIRLGDDSYLYTLLKARLEAYGEDIHKDKYSSYEYLKTLHSKYNDGKFDCNSRLELRRFLEHLQHNTINEYRRDRAKAQLRGIHLGRMALVLTVLLFFFGYFYLIASQSFFDSAASQSTSLTVNQSTNLTADQSTNITTYPPTGSLLLVVALAGGAGSVLSRAYRLGRRPLHAEAGIKTEEPPLGIRALISEWKVFIAQPVIGAAAALIVYLIFSSGVIQIGVGKLSPAYYALIAFLAGFSEPFFTGIVDRVEGIAGGSR